MMLPHLLRTVVWLGAFSYGVARSADLPATSPAQSVPDSGSEIAGYAPGSANPILPGYYADPSILPHQGKYYIYATLDPWGGETLACWESDDFRNWTYRVLNWPTKAACTSPTSLQAMVWAPSVVRAKNGLFYMYVSVGSEVWVGTADQPTGPWRNALGDKPLIPSDYKPGYHMIDAEAFLDDDGTAYLYWGSGLRWINGRCWAVKLKPDMVTFDGEVKDVTPANYFEGPFMLKQAGRYFLMSSTGRTTTAGYAVQVAVGDNPFGPFLEQPNTPILKTDEAINVIGPGHHAVFEKDGHHYIIYHRHRLPFDPKGEMLRQVCIDELTFLPDGTIDQVAPTNSGPAFIRREMEPANFANRAKATASSSRDSLHGPERVLDNNYGTQWAAANDAPGGWLELDLGQSKKFSTQELRFEYAWKAYRFTAESSEDGHSWKSLASYLEKPATGSPVVIAQSGTARFLRLKFPDDAQGSDLSLFEWLVR